MALTDGFAALAEARHPAPFDLLGLHSRSTGGWVVRIWAPWARDPEVCIEGKAAVPMREVAPGGFEADVPDARHPFAYRLRATDPTGRRVEWDDPYRFLPTLDEGRLHEVLAGREVRQQEVLGAHLVEVEGVRGTRFAVWAPHAAAVSVVGSHNGWDPRLHPMRPRGATGVWELFLPDVHPGTLYKYHLATPPGGAQEKADPVGLDRKSVV